MCHDARRWRAVTDYLQNDCRGGGLWDDVLSHQIDLARWLVGRTVTAARVPDSAGDRLAPARMRYTLEFKDGLEVNCMAGHHHAYEELVAVHLRRQTLLACPDGLIRVSRRLRPFLRLINRAGTYIHLVRCRLTGHSTESTASYRRQLKAFAAAIRADVQGTAAAAGLADGIDNIRIIQACRRSRHAAGQRITVARAIGAA